MFIILFSRIVAKHSPEPDGITTPEYPPLKIRQAPDWTPAAKMITTPQGF
jgi:hypothetical protein